MVKKIRRNRFAETLKAVRTSAGLNQLALAKLLGIAQPAVARYESGVREPDLDDLMTIAEKLNTTPNDLLGFNTPPPSTPSIKTGDINGNVIVGNGNTIGPPQSTSTSRSTRGKRKARQ